MVVPEESVDSPAQSRAGMAADEVPPIVAGLLQQAAEARSQPRRVESILWSAQAMYPQCLPVYFALYKFYFYQGRLEEAENATRQGLQAAAFLGDFAADWESLHCHSADWRNTFGPQHFYLFTLKALAFIRLRQGAGDDCLAILEKLAEIDPDDSIGATVIRDIAAGSIDSKSPTGDR